MSFEEVKIFYKYTFDKSISNISNINNNIKNVNDNDNLFVYSNNKTDDCIKDELINFLDKEDSSMSFKQMKNLMFFLYDLKGKEEILRIFKKYGFYSIFNNFSRHFYISVNSTKDIKFSFADGLAKPFDDIAYAMVIKKLGLTVLSKENVNLITITSR